MLPVLGVLDEVPAAVTDRLREAAMADAVNRLVLDRGRAVALGALADAGLRTVLLKGSALAASVYPTGVTRDMSDVDLLVRPDELAAATDVLTRAGWAPVQDQVVDMGRRHDAKLVDAHGLAPIELHRHLLDDVDRAALDAAEVVTRARPHGAHLLPAPHDLLLHVCMHFLAGRAVRSEGALSQLRDVAWIVGRADVDWAAAADVAAGSGVLDRVALVLAAVRRLGLAGDDATVGAPVDPRVVGDLLAARVLVDRPVPPVGAWRSFEEALWWSRRHLGLVAAGELADVSAVRVGQVATRRAAAARLALAVVAEPRRTARDLRFGRSARGLA